MTLYIWIWTFLTLQIASSCRKLINATAAEQLPKLLRENQVTDVFLDLDETLLMPDTLFIFGLPGTDTSGSMFEGCHARTCSTNLSQGELIGPDTFLAVNGGQLLCGSLTTGGLHLPRNHR